MKFFYLTPVKPLRPFLFVCLFFIHFLGSAQTNTSNPYSRFGLGKIEPGGFAHVHALGGAFSALCNDTLPTFNINTANPASYSTLKLTTFEFGVKTNFSEFSSSQKTVKKNNSGFNYISIGIPLNSRTGFVFGLTPYSTVGYQVTTLTDVANIGTIKNQYDGSGGLNQLFGGIGIKPFASRYKKFIRSSAYSALADSGSSAVLKRKIFLKKAISSLSLGCNAGYLFGTFSYATRTIFPGQTGVVYNTKQINETTVRDFNLNAGAQITFEIDSFRGRDLKKNVFITLGATASLPKNVRTTSAFYGLTYSIGSFGREIPFDTFLNVPKSSGKIFLPLMTSFGISLRKGENYLFLLEAGMQQWSQYTFLNSNQKLRDMLILGAGFQWYPNRQAIGSGAYFKRVAYRLGARYNSGYLTLKGENIGEYAVTAGLGLPVGRFRLFSVVNITGEYGNGGTKNSGLIAEKYYRAIIGLTINDKWFIKPKYD